MLALILLQKENNSLRTNSDIAAGDTAISQKTISSQ